MESREVKRIERSDSGFKFLIVLFTTALVLSAFVSRPAIVINRTPSLPTGIYYISPIDNLSLGATVLVRIPLTWRKTLTDLGYIDENFKYLVKRIVGMPGQYLESDTGNYRIDGRVVASIDPEGTKKFRTLARIKIPPGHVAVGSSHPKGVDSRFFGPISQSDILGSATLLLPFDF